LQRLEKRVGAKLVARTSQGSQLTPAGAAFEQRMRVLTRDAEDATQEARDLSGGQVGQLRVGATPAASVFALNALLPTLQLERPAATMSVVNAFDHALIDGLIRQDIELAVCPLPDTLAPGLDSELLLEDSYCLVLNASHPLSVHREVPLAALASCSWVSSPKNEFARQQTELAFERAGLGIPRVLVEVNSLPALLAAIANTQLVSLINSRGILPGKLPNSVVIRPLSKIVIPCPIGMVWRKRYVSSIAQRAMQLLRVAADREPLL
ncbi:MAG: hypothetical protein EON54_19705, partial [Alcaligenaceae bacterium]